MDARGKADEDRVWRAGAGPAGLDAPTAALQPGALVSRRPGDSTFRKSRALRKLRAERSLLFFCRLRFQPGS